MALQEVAHEEPGRIVVALPKLVQILEIIGVDQAAVEVARVARKGPTQYTDMSVLG